MRGGAPRWLQLAVLILSGEAIFALPFVVPRVFRPTMLAALDIDNTQLGLAFSAYGLVAMVSYGLGGPLADRFAPRDMMAAALLATAAGGLVMATLPAGSALVALYAFWGATTILLFWAGLIRSTREWGGSDRQGRAYGLLDGGRGLLAAAISTGLLALFAGSMAEGDSATAFRTIVFAVSGLVAACGVAVRLVLPGERSTEADPFRAELLGPVLRRPTLWLQAAIVVCAYVGYKGTDDISLMATDVLHYDEVQAASLGTVAFWLRPVGAVLAGLLADRLGGWRIVAGCFAGMALGNLLVVAGITYSAVAVLLSGVLASALAVYGLRGVYFALLAEGRVPLALTGTAVGVISVIGYTPDVFFGPLMGLILDGNPGPVGHRLLFALLTAVAIAGLAATLAFGRFVGPR